jgi:hypothetical protein
MGCSCVPGGGGWYPSGLMFMTLLVNVLWMLFLLLIAVLYFANAKSYRAELENIHIPDAE